MYIYKYLYKYTISSKLPGALSARQTTKKPEPSKKEITKTKLKAAYIGGTQHQGNHACRKRLPETRRGQIGAQLALKGDNKLVGL